MLSKQEVAVIKGIMKHYPDKPNQEILSYFSVPSRTVNPARLDEIKKGVKHKNVPSAPKNQVDDFLSGKTSLTSLVRMRTLLADGSILPRSEKVFGDIEVNVGLHIPVFQPYEGSNLEFKEFYEPSSIPVYAKILAGMVNAMQSGRIIFGVNDQREVTGVNSVISSKGMKNVQSCIKDHFSPYFDVKMERDDVLRKQIFCLRACSFSDWSRPVICTKDKHNSNQKQLLREGKIYYRYGDDTCAIRYPELHRIINTVRDHLRKEEK